MAWGYLSKLRQFSKENSSNAQSLINQSKPAPKWTSKPTSSFAKANTFAGSGGYRSKQSGMLSSRRRHFDDEDF
jgi:hypothetical protein